MRKSNLIVLASTNRHKFEEMTALFAKYPEIHLDPASNHFPNAQKLGLVETFDTYSQNAVAKARTCNHGCHYPSLSDDSGIEIDALDGRPGVRSHRYALPKAGQTQDFANVQKLLEELKNVPAEKRTARFVCHVALVIEGLLVHAVGTLEGTIGTEPKGHDGFGYDPIFIPKGYTETLAEIGPLKKNQISHRARAVEALMQEVKAREIVLTKP
jgi:XTP/dITP diphosphohydrolase